jgi:hypothetical protein
MWPAYMAPSSTRIEGVLVRLAKPPKPGPKPWFSSYYRKGDIKERDRKLFIK